MNTGRIIYFALLTLILTLSAGFYVVRSLPPETLAETPVIGEAVQAMTPPPSIAYDWTAAPARKTISGQYLAGHFAQSRYDWETANERLSFILDHGAADSELLKRSMVLAIGTGDMTLAARRAETLLDGEEDNSLALMTLAVKALADGQNDQALGYLDRMHAGDITDYIRPLLQGWAEAGEGVAALDSFDQSIIHSFHGALISLYLGDKKAARRYVDTMLVAPGLNGAEAERAGDLLVLIGDTDDALKLYQQLASVHYGGGDSAALAEKIKTLEEAPEDIAAQLSFLDIKTPAQGAALAMYDMAELLFQEHSENSARIFAQMALILNPDLVETRFLLANMAAQVNRLGEAISYLKAIPPTHKDYLKAQHAAADFLAETDRKDEAEALLYKLFTDFNDVESLIRIGDLHRRAEQFDEALKIYNRAARQVGDPIPEQYWYLLYARGMAYERTKAWDKAEKDLKAALGYRPNHPYLLNYLGYGWADQGLNLDESLTLIKQAVELRPTDGYIIDSLGWVYYMMGRYEEAIPPLERAVALMPHDTTMNDHLGDAYWQTGRRLEARFQWERARNHIDDTAEDNDPAYAQNLRLKLRYGLNIPEEARAAMGDPADDDK